MKKSKKINRRLNKKSCKQHYLEVFGFIKESRRQIYWVIGLFILLALVSFFLPVPARFEEFIKQIIQKMIESTAGLSTLELIGYIFFNNLLVSFIGIMFGILIGIVPIVLVLTNGYVLGYVARLSVNAQGLASLWKLLPHGIFELPAIFISLGLGLKLAGALFNKETDKTFVSRLGLAIKTFFLFILPLLLVAAIIEGVLIGLVS
jgi:stage II sporulation protein M